MQFHSLSIKGLLIVLTCFFISACGGESSNSSSNPPPQPPVTQSDTTAPVIKLNGDAAISLRQGEKYEDLGATATDNTDGSVAVSVTGEVDNFVAGEYILTYKAQDSAGNSSQQTRTITVQSFKPFVTTWDTTASGVTQNNQIMIDTQGNGFNYTVDWGDGSVDYKLTGDKVHTYATSGSYTVSIYGDFPHFYMAEVSCANPSGFSCEKVYASDNGKLSTVEQWGDITWQSMHASFRNTELSIKASDQPNLSNVNDMSFMLQNARVSAQSSAVLNVSLWDTSKVTDMSYLFNGVTTFFEHEPLVIGWDKWNVSNVTNMSHIFSGVYALSNDLSEWDVSKVTNMNCMFCSIEHLNVRGLDNWDVSNVTDMSRMFAYFRYGSLSNTTLANWDVSKVTNMQSMFAGGLPAAVDLSRWDVSSVTNMSYMFTNDSFSSSVHLDIANWNTSSVTDMSHMFKGIDSLNVDLSNWNTANVTQMQSMFERVENFNGDISNWNVSNVINMKAMFAEATNFDQDLSRWNVQNVTDMSSMFRDSRLFNQDLGNWNVANVTDTSYMFYRAVSFNQSIDNWNTSNIIDMAFMFYGAISFDGTLANWNTSLATNMSHMFYGAKQFNQDIGTWDVSKVKDMSYMFYFANNFDQALGHWQLTSIVDGSSGGLTNMFEGVTLSTENYDSTIIGWSEQSLSQSIRFHGGSSKYSRLAASARQRLVEQFNWSITDGGMEK